MSSSSPKRSLAIAVVPILLVLITFLFWYQTWFGRRLTDREIDQYLTDTSVPHKTQHALAQLAERMAQGDVAARRWYPQVLALVGSRETGFRVMAAWVMGQDNRSQEFHEALRKLLQDPEPEVRWNSALALARFGDANGRAQLRAMLHSYTVLAAQAGTVSLRLKPGDPARRGGLVARIQSGEAKPVEVHSPVEGYLERPLASEGAQVAAGDPIAVLSPTEAQIWESLRALYLVGTEEDLPEVERFARGVAGMSDRIRQQAALTAESIRRRTGGLRIP